MPYSCEREEVSSHARAAFPILASHLGGLFLPQCDSEIQHTGPPAMRKQASLRNSAPRAHKESPQASIDCFDYEVGVAGYRVVTETLFLKKTRLRLWSDDTRFRFSLQFAGCRVIILIKPYRGASMRTR